MDLVINISECTYKAKQRLVANQKRMIDEVDIAIANGTPLPKGHGDLIDRGELKTHFVGTEQGTDLEVYLESTIIDAHVIIPADKESEDKNAL